MHTRSDIYVSIGVLVTLVCLKLGLPGIVDPIASLVISGFVLHAAYEIFISTTGILVDKAILDTEKIKKIALGFQEVKDVHKIRSRGTQNDIQVDMHVMTKPDMSVEQSHALIHDIEKRMQKELNGNIQVIIHLEPFYKLN
jgi:cation diffusion facilitator family transporter